MSFYVGQKVVCVDASPCRSDEHLGQPFPCTQGSVHVIREFIPDKGEVSGIGVADGEVIRLFGLYDDGDWPLDARRFRPLDARRFRPLEEMKEEARQRQELTHPARI